MYCADYDGELLMLARITLMMMLLSVPWQATL